MMLLCKGAAIDVVTSAAAGVIGKQANHTPDSCKRVPVGVCSDVLSLPHGR